MPTEQLLSHRAALDLLERIGAHFGTGKKSGTYNEADPTHFGHFKLCFSVDPGFGPQINTPGDEDEPAYQGPPAGEIVVLDYNDCTWGISIIFECDSLGKIKAYWDNQTGIDKPGYWAWIQINEVYVTDANLPAEINRLHGILTRLIMEGDWGNDKLAQDEVEDPMGIIEV